MSKITINDKEYETDDFTEEQRNVFREAQMASSELDRLSYLGKVLDERRALLVQTLLNMLEPSSEPTDT